MQPFLVDCRLLLLLAEYLELQVMVVQTLQIKLIQLLHNMVLGSQMHGLDTKLSMLHLELGLLYQWYHTTQQTLLKHTQEELQLRQLHQRVLRTVEICIISQHIRLYRLDCQ